MGKEPEDGKRDELNNLVLQDFYKKTQDKANQQVAEITQLRNSLNHYATYDSLSTKIAPEIRILFPKIQHIALAKVLRASIHTTQTDTLTIAILSYQSPPSTDEINRFREWLATRMDTQHLELLQDK